MKVLWLCNIMLPAIAEALGKKASNKEGWLTGLSAQLLQRGKENDIKLGVCFPIGKEEEPIKGTVNGMDYFGFPEDTVSPHQYDESMEKYLTDILEEFNPDVVHVFGTEYPHTLAMTRCIKDKKRLLIGIQGLCALYAEGYMADLPEYVQNRFLLRDFLKQDNIKQQQKKFQKRGDMEVEAIKNASHVTGRTDWDREGVLKMNANLTYHFMNETLRANFYDVKWQINECEPYSIFLSQGNYPIKGLHYVLKALPEILKKFPKTKVYVAGDVITAYETLKQKIKIGSYGKYCLDLIREYNLQEHVVFLGRLDSKSMCDRYLKSHVFLSPSVLENSSNSVGEAMLLGMPVISSEVGGIPSILADKKEGIMYPCNDTMALAEAVCTMFANDAMAIEYGMQARERALVTHDPERNYKRLLEIYRGMNS